MLAASGAEDPEQAGRLLCAAIDGLMLQALASSGGPPDASLLADDLRRLLSALLARP